MPPIRRVIGLSAALLLILFPVLVRAADDPPEKRFAAADGNGDKKISLEEILKLPGEQPVLKRDFLLFDLDGDKSLTAAEFEAVPLGRPAEKRGPLPDPILAIADRAVAQLDETYGQWDQNPKKQIAVQDFVQSFLLSFPEPNRVTNNVAALHRDADENQNQRVSRDEARRFLEIQLGIRRSDGNVLRQPSGRVVANSLFLALDPNGDQVIEREEFLAAAPDKEKREEHWKLLDQDKNGSVTFPEFLNPQWIGVVDPVEEFRKSDTDLDALLDEKELLAGTPEASKSLAKHAIPAFDVDGDKKLSLWEFRQLPQANPALPWQTTMTDANRDGALQFHEFTVLDGRFPLLRLIYFYRFDHDGSGALEKTEFAYKVMQPAGLYRVNADGTGWTLVFASEKYPDVGSPKISRDGKWLAFDAIERGQSGNNNRKMLLATIDGKDVRELGLGMMPTWSGDGKTIAFSKSGVQTLDLETKQIRSLVPNGWSAQFSPDGKKIAFTEGAGLKTIDVESEDVATLLDPNDTPYQQIYWNIGWAGDGTRICFKGVRKNGDAEIASVSVAAPPDLKVHYHGKRAFRNNFAWSPDATRILFGMQAADSPRITICELNPKADAEPVAFKGLDPAVQSEDGCWSPDGKFVIINGRPD